MPLPMCVLYNTALFICRRLLLGRTDLNYKCGPFFYDGFYVRINSRIVGGFAYGTLGSSPSLCNALLAFLLHLSLSFSLALSLSALRPHLSWLRSVLLQMHNVAGIVWNRGGSVYLSKETFFCETNNSWGFTGGKLACLLAHHGLLNCEKIYPSSYPICDLHPRCIVQKKHLVSHT